MIKVYFGVLGASKSWAATECIIDYLKQGRHVLTNIELLEPGITEACGPDAWERVQMIFTREEIVKFYQRAKTGQDGAHNLVVLDEVHKYLDAHYWRENRSDHKELLDWCDMSRRFGNDLILTTHHPSKIDGRLRGLCEVFILRRGWAKLPVVGWLWPGFQEKQYDMDCRTVIRASFKARKEIVGRCYKTLQVVGDKPTGSGEIMETPNAGAPPWHKRLNWKMWLAIVCLIWGLYAVSDYWQRFKSGEALGNKAKESAPPQVIRTVETPALFKRSGDEPPPWPSNSSEPEKLLWSAGYIGWNWRVSRSEYYVGPMPLRPGVRWGRWKCLAIEDDETWWRWDDTGETKRILLVAARDDPYAPGLTVKRDPLPNPYGFQRFSGNSASGTSAPVAFGPAPGSSVQDSQGRIGARIVGELPAPQPPPE